MSAALEERLRTFATELLERNGAMVDWPENGDGLALAPAALARTLHVAEEVRLTTQAGAARDLLPVNLATDFMERVDPLIAACPFAAELRLDGLYLKRSAMDLPVARFFGFPNARVRVTAARAARIAYHCWHFSAVVDSEERWEELVTIQMNSATGAAVEFADPLSMMEAVPAIEPLAETKPDLPSARRKAAWVAAAKASSFLGRLEQRLGRDRRRIAEYYAALLAESSPTRFRGPVDEAKLGERRRAVEVEQRRRQLELDERYALRLRLDPIALVVLDMPVLEVELEVSRRPAKGVARVYWNPLLKELEPLACARCGDDISVVFFDAALRPLCRACDATP